MADISASQKKTRRRAVGRRLIRKASDLSVMCGDLNVSADMEFLDSKEVARLKKLMDQLRVVGKHLDSMGTKLDQA